MLRAAGLSDMDASRAERLAGYNNETRPRPTDTPAILKERHRLFKAGKQASEAYYADAKANGRVPSKDGLRLAVDSAIAIAAGKPARANRSSTPISRFQGAARHLLAGSDDVERGSLSLRSFNEKFPAADDLAERMYTEMRRPIIGTLKSLRPKS